MKQLDLNNLLIFIELSKTGSFTKTATNLGCPKSKISRNISSLERELGLNLVHRSTRHVKLTNEGKYFLSLIDLPFKELNESFDRIKTNDQELEGTIKFSVPEDIGIQVVADLVAEFKSLYPKVEFFLDVSNRNVNLVKESFDLALRVGRLPDTNFKHKKICKVKLILVGNLKKMNAEGKIKSIQSLSTLPFLAFIQDTGTQKSIKLERSGVYEKVELNKTLTSNNFFVLKKLAVQGIGFTFLPKILIEEELRTGQLDILFPEWNLSETEMSLLFQNQKNIPIRLRKFIDFLSQRLPLYF